jgi:PAS domain S-box-containing protein
MSTSNQTISFSGFSIQQLDSLFPFHFIINYKMELISIGNSIKKINPLLQSTYNFQERLYIKSEDNTLDFNFQELDKRINQSIQIGFYNIDDVYLIGQITEHLEDTKKQLLFIGTLRTSKIENLLSIGLTLDDFPAHDPIRELFDIQSKHLTEINEIRKCASFPNENPYPVLRADLAGHIIFRNRVAKEIEQISVEGIEYDIQDYLISILNKYRKKENLQIEIESKGQYFSLIICPIPSEGYYNIYGAEITEKKESELIAKENFDRLNNFLESTDDAYYIVYQKNKIKNYFTSRWPLFFGFNPKTGNIWKQKRETVVDEHRKLYDDAQLEFQSTGHLNLKYKIKNKISGHTRWILEEARIKIDENLNDEIISGRITDISTSENFRSLVNETEERFRLITESMPVMIWVSDEDNIVIYTNQASKDFYGFDLKDLHGQHEYVDIVHPDYKKIAIDDWRHHLNARVKCEMQYLAKNKEGEYRWIFEIAVPRFTNQNAFLGYIGCAFDITNERNTYFQLEEEKKKYELISNKSADIIFLTNKDGIIEYVSSSIKRILGREESNVKGLSFYNLIDDSSSFRSIDFTDQDQNNNRVLSFKMKHISGDSRWVEAVYSNFTENELGGEKILIHVRDINEQYLAQNMLIENEARYRRLFSNMNLGIVEVDVDEKILYVNRSFERISGYEEHELIGKNASDVFIKDTNSQVVNIQENRNRILGKEGLYEIRVTKKDGSNAIWVISGAPTFDMKGKVRGSIGIHWDVTEIRALENKLLTDSLMKEKELMEARLQAEEEQREMIGRDLHDGVGQMLAYLSLYFNVLIEKTTIQSADIEKAQTTLKSTIDEVRRLSRNLAPPAIKDLGFREAVIELINSYGIIPKPKFQLNIYKGIDPKQLLHEHKLMLFRVIQELSSNTFKHAKADNVVINIDHTDDYLEMYYKDDGIGFDTNHSKKGVGLKSILSRLEFYGGKIKINTHPGDGTEVIIKLPYQ